MYVFYKQSLSELRKGHTRVRTKAGIPPNIKALVDRYICLSSSDKGLTPTVRFEQKILWAMRKLGIPNNSINLNFHWSNLKAEFMTKEKQIKSP